MKTVVFIKTHIWDKSIFYFVKKIRNECISVNIDFFLLAQDNLINTIPKMFSSFTKYYSENDIKNIYDIG